MMSFILSKRSPYGAKRNTGIFIYLNRVGGESPRRPLTPPYVRCRIRRFKLNFNRLLFVQD